MGGGIREAAVSLTGGIKRWRGLGLSTPPPPPFSLWSATSSAAAANPDAGAAAAAAAAAAADGEVSEQSISGEKGEGGDSA